MGNPRGQTGCPNRNEEHIMTKEMDDLSKMGQVGMDGTLKIWGDWAKSWQAVTAEMTDYSKRSIEDGTRTMEKLMTARSFEQVMEIQSSYAKRAYDDYMLQMSRLGSMYADMAKDSAKPFERFQPTRR
jgi:hypothetical protein